VGSEVQTLQHEDDDDSSVNTLGPSGSQRVAAHMHDDTHSHLARGKGDRGRMLLAAKKKKKEKGQQGV
jgi:hypothetical protein